MKKVFKILSVIILLLVIGIISLPFLFKGELIQMVKDEANNNLNAKVDFGEFDLSIISTFPDFKFEIHDVKVDGVDKFEGVTLAKIGTLETTLDIMSVINGEQIGIKSFQIINPEINAIVLQDSTANWDIAKSSGEEEVTEEPVDTAETKFDIALKYYAIKNAHIVYDDKPGNMYAELVDFTHEGSGDFTQDIFELNTITLIKELTYKMNGVSYAKKMNIDFKVDMEIDNPNAKYTFKENEFKFNQLSLGLDGWVAMPENADMSMDLSFKSNQTTFKSILSMVPAIYLTDFNDIQTDGKLAFNGYAKGTMTDTDLPAFGVNLNVDDAMFKYPDLPESVKNIQIAISANNPGGSDDRTVVDIKKFHLEMGDNPVDIKLLVKTPVSDPDMAGSVKAQIDMASIKDFIPVEEGESYTGNVTCDLDFAGKMSTIDAEDYENFEAKGNLIVLDMNYQTPSMPYQIDIKKLYMDFSPKYVELTSFESKIGKSDISANGRVDNFLAYTFRDEPLSGSFNMSSNYMDLNEFMTEDEVADSTAVATDSTSEGIVEVPANINFVMQTDIKEMLYDNITMKNVKGGVTIKDQQVILDKLFMNLMEGSLLVTGKYDTKNEFPVVDFTYDIKNFDLPQTFATFNTVQKLAPVAENAKGAISTSLRFTTQLDNNMEPIMNSMNGGGDLFTHKVILEGSKTINKVADALQQEQFKKLNVGDTKVKYEFKDGRLHVSPFDMKLGNIKANFGGSHGFDETMDYKMVLDIPTSEFGSTANNALNSLLSQGDQFGLNAKMPERIDVDVFIRGTLSDPKITTGLKGTVQETVKDQVKQVVEEKIEEVKQQVEEKVEEVIEDTKAKAREEADKILAEAEKQAQMIRDNAQKAADAAKKQGYAEADQLEKSAKNPLEKAAAKVAAEKLRKETDKKADQIIAEGDAQAKKVLDTARKQADDLLK